MKFLLALAIIAGIWWFGRRKQAAQPRPSAGEARAILSLGPEAGTEEILAAHRRLIARVHPDTGGSAALAARVNAARDVLLSGRAETR